MVDVETLNVCSIADDIRNSLSIVSRTKMVRLCQTPVPPCSHRNSCLSMDVNISPIHKGESNRFGMDALDMFWPISCYLNGSKMVKTYPGKHKNGW